MNNTNWIYAYYQEIKSGSVVVGRWIKLLYEIIVHGIEQKRYYFDQKKANKSIKFIETFCHHSEGPLAPGTIKLELWQKAVLSIMFGILDKNGRRQFREVFLVVSRKNGKSLFASAIAIYEFFVDGGFGTRIYNIAPKLDQAEIIYNDIWQGILCEPELKAVARHRMTDLFIESTNSTVKKIAFSAKKSDGFNPSLTICDEIASWQGDAGLKQYEVMKSGMGARPEAILLSISTAGYVNEGIYDELMKRSTRFLLGDSKETRLLPLLYTIDDIDKWNDINELRKSNPNLGVSVSVDYLLEEIAVAEGSLSKKAEFITKYCNIKQNSSQAWLSTKVVDQACGGHLSLEDFKGCYCVGGIDLSQTTDLTAAVAVIEKDGKLYIFAKFFLPAEKIEEATERDGVPYDIYIKRGLLQPSGENFVDYHDAYQFFIDLVRDYKIFPLKVGYDRYSAQYLVQDMKAAGFHMDDVYQGDNLYPVIQEFEGLMKDGSVNIGDNDLLKIHLLNSAIKMNVERGRGRLVKIHPSAHIDGVAALLDAFCVRQKYYGEIGAQLKNQE